jgi:hypothetical protein
MVGMVKQVERRGLRYFSRFRRQFVAKMAVFLRARAARNTAGDGRAAWRWESAAA